MLKFNGPGLKTTEGARARLGKIALLLMNSKTLVAEQDGKFYPVAVLSNEDAHFAFEIASNGVFALKV